MRLLIISALILLISCSGNNGNYEIYIIYESVDGISESTKVYSKGLEVGNVSELSLTAEHDVLVTIEILQKFEFPKDSRVKNNSNNFFGNQSIFIEPGKSSEYLEEYDTIYSSFHVLPSKFDSLVNAFQNAPKVLDSLTRIKNDSILIELQRMNDNLEKLTE